MLLVVLELFERKCIRSCNDGFYWSTNFPCKTERKFIDTHTLKTYMDAPDTKLISDFFKEMGVVSREAGGSFKDQHSVCFCNGRDMQYPKEWFK